MTDQSESVTSAEEPVAVAADRAREAAARNISKYMELHTGLARPSVMQIHELDHGQSK